MKCFVSKSSIFAFIFAGCCQQIFAQSADARTNEYYLSSIDRYDVPGQQYLDLDGLRNHYTGILIAKKECSGKSCEPLPPNSNGCNANSSNKNPHCSPSVTEDLEDVVEEIIIIDPIVTPEESVIGNGNGNNGGGVCNENNNNQGNNSGQECPEIGIELPGPEIGIELPGPEVGIELPDIKPGNGLPIVELPPPGDAKACFAEEGDVVYVPSDTTCSVATEAGKNSTGGYETVALYPGSQMLLNTSNIDFKTGTQSFLIDSTPL